MTKIIDIPKEVPVEYLVKTMSSKQAVLSVMLIVLLGSQWLVPLGMARPIPAHPGHSAHGYPSSSTVTPLQHPCCDDSALGFHEDLCCGACPALPGAIADFGSYTPYLSLTVAEPQEKGLIFLALLWHPPTL